MRFAVISDIHNNLEAFKTTLEDVEKQDVEKICCLGDLLGYGPKPLECVDLMMNLRDKGRVDVCLLGNHDQAALFDPEGFNQIAEAAVNWTRKILENDRGRRATERWDFIGEMPRIVRRDPFLFVHGSSCNPLNEYVFPEDFEDEKKMWRLFDKVAHYCFMGHTHVPGIFVDRSDKVGYQYLGYETLRDEYQSKFPLGDQKLLINVGSIGQPRDQIRDSCYVVVQYDPNGKDNYVEYRRVPYDFKKTVEAIEKIPELNQFPFLKQRIQEGR